MGLIDTSNRFDFLSVLDSPAPTDIDTPTALSSQFGVQHTSRAKKAVLNPPPRILIMYELSID